VHLTHDLLDTLVRDKHRTPIGRADGVRIELRDGAPPKVSAVVLSGTVLVARLGRRLGPRLARLAAAVHRRVRGVGPTPTRIPVSLLSRDGESWKVDEVDGRDTPALAWELWLRAHVVAKVPLKGE
jgi:hypothetical protein